MSTTAGEGSPAAAVLAGILAVALLPLAVAGQGPEWQLDVNASRIQSDTLDALNAPSVATSVEWRRQRLMTRLAGSLTGFENNGQAIQGRGDLVGWLSPAGTRSPLRLEVSGGAGGSSHSGGFESFVGQGDTRLHVQGARAGAWLGVGASLSKNSLDVNPVSSVMPNIGGWYQVGPTRLIARYVDTRVEGERFPEVNLSAVYGRGSVDVTAFGGYRASPFETVEADSWFGGSVALWLQSRLAILVSGGQYAPDVLQGLPGGQFFSVGLRYAPQRRRPPATPGAPLPLMFTRQTARSGEAGFVVEGARTVEIAGDWNGWQPTPLSRGSNGRWLLPTDVPPGVHRFNLLLNGERWIVPEGLPSVDDGFGGTVALLVISER